MGFPAFRSEPAIRKGKGRACSGFRRLSSLCHAFREVVFPLEHLISHYRSCQGGQASCMGVRVVFSFWAGSTSPCSLRLSSGGPCLGVGCPAYQASWCRGTPRSSWLDCPSTRTLIGGALELVGTNFNIMTVTYLSWVMTLVCPCYY